MPSFSVSQLVTIGQHSYTETVYQPSENTAIPDVVAQITALRKTKDMMLVSSRDISVEAFIKLAVATGFEPSSTEDTERFISKSGKSYVCFYQHGNRPGQVSETADVVEDFLLNL